jgi:hypothetical protein
MRLVKSLLVIPVLALLVVSCAPRRSCPGGPGEPCGKTHKGMRMAHHCGPDACSYHSKCFSDGAVHSNDGVCQACSTGKWVSASGCHEHSHHDCPGKKGKKSGPCPDKHRRHHHEPRG